MVFRGANSVTQAGPAFVKPVVQMPEGPITVAEWDEISGLTAEILAATAGDRRRAAGRPGFGAGPRAAIEEEIRGPRDSTTRDPDPLNRDP